MQIQTRRMVLRSLIAASVYAGLPAVARASEGCCSHCGCSSNRCRKVCRLVSEDRKITTTCWGMECEDFCVPGPSTPECKHCEMVCKNGPDDKQVCGQPKRLVWTSWRPGCGQEIHTKRKLMKKTVTKKVPSFKWVVEDLCVECTAKCEPISVPTGIKIPSPPNVVGTQVLVSHSTPGSSQESE